jgi:hypothetical protein
MTERKSIKGRTRNKYGARELGRAPERSLEAPKKKKKSFFQDNYRGAQKGLEGPREDPGILIK